MHPEKQQIDGVNPPPQLLFSQMCRNPLFDEMFCYGGFINKFRPMLCFDLSVSCPDRIQWSADCLTIGKVLLQRVAVNVGDVCFCFEECSGGRYVGLYLARLVVDWLLAFCHSQVARGLILRLFLRFQLLSKPAKLLARLRHIGSTQKPTAIKLVLSLQTSFFGGAIRVHP